MAKAKAEYSGSEYGGAAWFGARVDGGVVGKTNCSRLPAVKPAIWLPWSPLEYRFAHGEESHLRVMRDILGEMRLPIQQRNFGGGSVGKLLLEG